MSDRDDREADQAQIAALEAELASLRRRLAQLEGEGGAARPEGDALVVTLGTALEPRGRRTRRAQARWLGAPLQVDMSRRFEGAYPSERLEELVDRIREITRDPGIRELGSTSLTWSSSGGSRSNGRYTFVLVNVRGGATTLTVGDKLGQLAASTYIGGACAGAIGVMMLAGALGVLSPAAAGVALVGGSVGVFALVRGLFRVRARRRAEIVEDVFDAVATEITTQLPAP